MPLKLPLLPSTCEAQLREVPSQTLSLALEEELDPVWDTGAGKPPLGSDTLPFSLTGSSAHGTCPVRVSWPQGLQAPPACPEPLWLLRPHGPPFPDCSRPRLALHGFELSINGVVRV